MSASESKLSNLSEKIAFMLKLNADFEKYARTSFEGVARELDAFLPRTDSERNISDCVENIKVIFEEKMLEIESELQDVVDALNHHRELLISVASIPAGTKKDELVLLLLEEAGVEEELDVFKKRVLTEELERRKSFKSFIDEILETIQDGDVIELEAFLEHELLKESAAKFDEDEDSLPEESFDENEIANFLKQLKEPISLQQKEEGPQDPAES